MEDMENQEALAAPAASAPEESPRLYTREEVDAIVGRRLARKDAKLRREQELRTAPEYDPRDTRILGRADAQDIIESGYDRVVEEVDRLSALGTETMTDREKERFRTLARHRRQAEQSRELARLGADAQLVESREFQTFAGKFSAATPIREVYDIYRSTLPRQEFETMGSMKTTADPAAVKEFYGPEEARRFTKADFDKNPALFEAVVSSMQKWK